VKTPRFRIDWVMIFIAVAALNFGAIRATANYSIQTGVSLYVGAIPMGNLLAIVLMIGLQRRKSHRFLLGFELFGTMALVLYIAMAILFVEKLSESYLELAASPMRATLGRNGWTTPRLIIAYPVLSLWACLPQLAVALIGGFLSRNFRIR
jgi:hypothetical protein